MLFVDMAAKSLLLFCRKQTLMMRGIFAETWSSMVPKTRFETDVGEQRITISAGVISTSNRIFDNVDELFKAADEALYTAKNQGRDQVTVE